MKYSSLYIFLLLFCISSYAQDTIVQKNGIRIPAKVIEIDKKDVKYKKFENPDGPSYLVPKSDVSFIRYQNGTADTFHIPVSYPQIVKSVIVPKSEMYLKGQKDAETYYTKFKPAGYFAFGLTLPLNALGVIPAAAISATPPKKENLDYPDVNLLGNPDYMQGYVAKAKDKKGKYVMKNFAWGCLGSFVIYGSMLLLK
jgi:hypothetical protein